MEGFLLYCLFAITTALTAMYELVIPVVSRRDKDPKPWQGKHIMYFTLFILCMLAAPLVILSCFIPSWGDRFRGTLYTALFEEQEI